MAIISATKSLKADLSWDNDWANRENSGSGVLWSITPNKGVLIDDPDKLNTFASFEYTGTYKAKIIASDGAMAVSDEKIITITDEDLGKIDIPLSGDEDVTVTANVTLPTSSAVFEKLDCIIDIDISGSMGSVINTAKERAVEIVNALFTGGRDVQMGVHKLTCFWPEDTDILCNLSSDITTITMAINRYFIGRGSNEHHLESFYHAISNANWRDGSLRIYIQFTDEKLNHYYNVETSINDAKSYNIRVIYINCGYSYNKNAELEELSQETNGACFELGSSATGIVEAIESALEGMSKNLTVKLVPDKSAPAGLIKNIQPEKYTNISPGDNFSFDVTFNRSGLPAGSGTAKYNFNLEIIAEDTVIIDIIPVSITVSWT